MSTPFLVCQDGAASTTSSPKRSSQPYLRLDEVPVDHNYAAWGYNAPASLEGDIGDDQTYDIPCPYELSDISDESADGHGSDRHTEEASEGRRAIVGNTLGDNTASVECDLPDEWHGKTSVMVRNLPYKCTPKMFFKELCSAGFQNSVNYVYVPVNHKSFTCKGYAFVNFNDPSSSYRFHQMFDSAMMRIPGSKKSLQVIPANLQGYEENSENAWQHNVGIAFDSRGSHVSARSNRPARGEQHSGIVHQRNTGMVFDSRGSLVPSSSRRPSRREQRYAVDCQQNRGNAFDSHRSDAPASSNSVARGEHDNATGCWQTLGDAFDPRRSPEMAHSSRGTHVEQHSTSAWQQSMRHAYDSRRSHRKAGFKHPTSDGQQAHICDQSPWRPPLSREDPHVALQHSLDRNQRWGGRHERETPTSLDPEPHNTQPRFCHQCGSRRASSFCFCQFCGMRFDISCS